MKQQKLNPRPLTKRWRTQEPGGLLMWGEVFTLALFLAGFILFATDKMGIQI